MAARRPLVRKDGRIQQLPHGDTLLGLPLFVPAYQRGGGMLRLAMTAAYAIQVGRVAGAPLNVSAVMNG